MSNSGEQDRTEGTNTLAIPDIALGREWTILELLCLGLTTPAERELFENLIGSDTLSWGELLEQSMRHKMVTMLAYEVWSSGIERTVSGAVRYHLRAVLDRNRYKRIIWYEEASRISKALGEDGVTAAGRKAVAFETDLYDGNGSRRVGDIDFLVSAEDKDAVVRIMTGLGYEVGQLDWRFNSVVPFERQEMMVWNLSPDHFPPFTLVTNNLAVPDIPVDFATSLTWARSEFEVPMQDVLDEKIDREVTGQPGIVVSCLSPTFQFIDTVLHLFREAWHERWWKPGQDVDLMKFGDVLRLWRMHRKILRDIRFAQTLEHYGITEAVVWVLEHLDRTFGTRIVSDLSLQNRVTEEWLNSARAPGGKALQWKGTMRERLHSKNRSQLLIDTV